MKTHMMRWYWVGAACCGWLLFAVAVLTQNPIQAQSGSQIDIGSVVALDMTADGSLLLAADAESQSLLIYDVDNPSSPRLIHNISLDGTPAAAAWVDRSDSAAFVAVETSDGAPILQLIARPTYNPRQGYILYSTYDLAALPEAITASPNGDWAALYGETGLTLLEILSWDEINSSYVWSDPVASAALTDSHVLFAAPSSEQIVNMQIVQGPQLSDESQAEMVSEILSLNVAAGGDISSVLLSSSHVVLFDADTGSMIAEQIIRSRPQPTHLTSVSHTNGTWLIVYASGASSAEFLDTNGRTLSRAFALSTANPIRLLTGANSLIATTDGSTIDLYTP